MSENLPATPPGAGDDELPDLLKQLSAKKYRVALALIQSYGNITQACQTSGISRRTFSYWRQNDPIFKEWLESEEFEEQKKDFAEHILLQNIQAKKEISTIFFLKTKARDRGYDENNQKAPDPKELTQRKPSWFTKEQEELPDTSAWETNFEEAVIIEETKTPEK